MGELTEKGFATNLSSSQALQAFLGGQTGTLITSSASRANLEEQAGFDLGATAFPRFGTQPLRLPAGGNNLFVFSDSEAKRAAAKDFVEFLTTNPQSVETWVTGTGYLPPLASVAGQRSDSSTLQAIAEKSAQYLTPWVSFPGPDGLEASQIMYDAIQAIMGGMSTAPSALRSAAAEINDLIDGEGCG